MYFFQYSMYVVFSQFLKCSEDSEIPNSIFYVCRLRYISFFEAELFFQWECCFFWASGILEDGSVAFVSYEFISFFWNRIVFSMWVFVFLLQAFWQTVLWPFFIWIHMFFWNRLAFLMRVFVFFASGILEDGSVAFFHLNLKVFSKQNCFFNDSGCFFGFRHFGKRFWALFSYEFIRFFEAELFFQWKCLLFWLQAFWKTVLWPFLHMNL